MAKRRSNKKTKSVVLGIALTLIFVLLGGCITAIVTQTNPKDWFMKTGYTAPEYSEWGHEPVKEYKKLYLNTTYEALEELETMFDAMQTAGDEEMILACIGDIQKFDNYLEFTEYEIIAIVRENVEDNFGRTCTIRALTLVNVRTNDSVILYSSESFAGTYYLEPFEKGFQNLGEHGLLVLDGEPIKGAVAKGESVEKHNIISINPVK